MNNKGQLLGVAIVLAIFILIVGFSFLNLLRPEIERARNSDGLDCSNSAVISDGTKVACLITGTVMPYMIWTVISIVGGLTITRFLK